MLMLNNIKNKKVFIIIISIIIILIIVGVLLFINYNKNKKLEMELQNITTNYYDNDFVELMPNLLKRNGTIQITLKTLKQLDKDLSFFEKNGCDLENTYVVLTYNEKTKYNIETHLDCK